MDDRRRRVETLERIHRAVRSAGTYRTPSDHVPESQRSALDQVGALLADPTVRVEEVRARVDLLHRDGIIDRARALSALAVIAASPRVADFAEASRLVGEQEFAALVLTGDDRTAALASVDRHRGVIAFLMGRPEVALENFTRALERERSAENLANVLASLVRCGDVDHARDLLDTVRGSFPPDIRAAVDAQIALDEDLASLR